MKSFQFNEYGDSSILRIVTLPIPVPKTGQVLVKILFAGVNPIDWKLRSGDYKAFMPVLFPSIPGVDFSGIVEALGPGVTSFQPGQKVFGLATGGTYAEFALASESDVAILPSGVSPSTAASLPVGALTAWKSVDDAGIRAGQKVLILGGAGGVGIFSVQLAKQKGAEIWATASGANGEYMKTLGCDHPVDYTQGEISAPAGGFDAVLDNVGGEAQQAAYALLKEGGTLVTIAGPLNEELAKLKKIRAIRSGRGDPVHLKAIAEMVANGKLKTEVSRIFPFEEARQAQDLVQTGHGRGRVILEIG